jgi:hypothetical protein
VFRTYFSLESLYVSYPISWALSAAAAFACIAVILRRRIREQQKQTTEV